MTEYMHITAAIKTERYHGFIIDDLDQFFGHIACNSQSKIVLSVEGRKETSPPF